MKRPKPKTPKIRKRAPRAERGRKLRKNPAFNSELNAMIESSIGNIMVQAALHGATFVEKTVVAAVLPGLLAIVRSGGKFTHEDHWEAFKPHCPQIAGVLCPLDCKHYGEVRFDGCHVCGCLHGEQYDAKR